ncbi:MAG: cytochrome c biogenesis protein ResB [bacterium]
MSDSVEAKEPVAKPAWGNPVTRVLGSLAFALTVVLLLALACIAGTLIPQGSQVEVYLARPGGHQVLGVLSALGLTRVFYSWWFVGLLFALAASLMVCTGRRYQAIKRSTGAARLRVIGSFITHVSLLLVLAGGVVRVIWGQKGAIQFREGEAVSSAESSDGPMVLPFSLRLTKFELEYHKKTTGAKEAPVDMILVQWAEKNLIAHFPVELNVEHPVVPADAPAGASPAFRVKVLRYVADFALDGATGDVKSRSDVPNNPAVQVCVVGSGSTNTQWVFARFPDFGSSDSSIAAMPLKFRFMAVPPEEMGMRGGDIKAFKSTVEVIEKGAVVSTRTIAVNSPFSWGGYTFYQTSYNPDDLAWSALQVVRDPGIPIVYAGFVLMMTGLTLVFCVGPWLGDQRRRTGELS